MKEFELCQLWIIDVIHSSIWKVTVEDYSKSTIRPLSNQKLTKTDVTVRLTIANLPLASGQQEGYDE